MACEQPNPLYKTAYGRKNTRANIATGSQDEETDENDKESKDSKEVETWQKLKKMQACVRVRPYRLAFESPLFNRLLLSVNQLRHYVKFQRYLPHDLGPEFFANIIKSSDYDLIQAEQNLKNYFYCRQEDHFIFRNRNPLDPENENIFKAAFCLPLAEHSSDELPILYAGLTNPDPKVFTLKGAIRLFFLTVDLIIHESFWDEGKFDIFLDGSGLTLHHFHTFQDTETLRHLRTHIKECYVPRIMHVHCINVPIAIIQSIRLFRNAKSAPKVFIHDSLYSLSNFIPTKTLPDEYGGEAGGKKEIIDRWRKYVISSTEWLVKEESNRIDEYERRSARDVYRARTLERRRELYELEVRELLQEMQEEGEEITSEPEIISEKTKKK